MWEGGGGGGEQMCEVRFKGGSSQMLTIDDKGGEGGHKSPKTC